MAFDSLRSAGRRWGHHGGYGAFLYGSGLEFWLVQEAERFEARIVSLDAFCAEALIVRERRVRHGCDICFVRAFAILAQELQPPFLAGSFVLNFWRTQRFHWHKRYKKQHSSSLIDHMKIVFVYGTRVIILAKTGPKPTTSPMKV